MNQIDSVVMFVIPLSKTNKGVELLDHIHNIIYKDNNEKKTSRHDDKLVRVVLFLMYINPEYANHISIMKMPISIRERCSIACARSDIEYIYLMPDSVVDPLNKDSSLISEISYDDVKNSAHVFIEHIEVADTRAPPSSPVSQPSSLVSQPSSLVSQPSSPVSQPSSYAMIDADIFNDYDID